MAKRKRKKAVGRYASKIAARDGGWYCHYCGRRIYKDMSELPGAHEIWCEEEQSWVWVADSIDLYCEVDHVIPWSRGGSNSLDNLVLSCRECNAHKGAMTRDEYLVWLEAQHD